MSAIIDKMGLHQVKKLLQYKGKNYQNKETIQRMGEKSLSDIHLTRD
jgi:hypothetical protein